MPNFYSWGMIFRDKQDLFLGKWNLFSSSYHLLQSKIRLPESFSTMILQINSVKRVNSEKNFLRINLIWPFPTNKFKSKTSFYKFCKCAMNIDETAIARKNKDRTKLFFVIKKGKKKFFFCENIGKSVKQSGFQAQERTFLINQIQINILTFNLSTTLQKLLKTCSQYYFGN